MKESKDWKVQDKYKEWKAQKNKAETEQQNGDKEKGGRTIVQNK